MESKNITKILFVVIVIIAAFVVLLPLFGASWINSNPGFYEYKISTEGLSQYQGGLITDIIVPMPMRDGSLVFSEEELQNQQFGNWKSVIVVTPHGKMLAFQSTDGDLTDIDADFFKKFDPGELAVTDIRDESLSPLIRENSDESKEWNSGTENRSEYVSIIFLPEDLVPLNANATDIVVNLELTISEGLNHSILGDTFRVTILERIPPEIRGEIPVNAHITQHLDGNWVPLNG
jgi:hypothetical protein